MKSYSLSAKRTGSAEADFKYSKSDFESKSGISFLILKYKLSWTEAYTTDHQAWLGRAFQLCRPNLLGIDA